MIKKLKKSLFIILIIFLFFSLPIQSKSLPLQSEKTKNQGDTIALNDTSATLKPQERDTREELDDLKKRIEELEKRTDERHKLQITGFFDVSISNYQNKPNIFEVGSLELDLAHTYKENFQVAAALVFDEGASLGVGFIDYHIYGGSISPRGRLFQEQGIHIQVGKFDVPVGNDWRHFVSLNRISVNAPLTTEILMEEGYNDVGLRLLGNFIAINMSLHVLRGIEEGYSYGGNSYGGRLGFTPFSNPYLLKSKNIPVFEIGFSYLHDVDKAGTTSEQLFAGDVESKIGPLILRSEYYRRDKKIGILLTGYHITGAINIADIFDLPLKIFTRYDSYRFSRYKKGSETNDLKRISGGLNLNIAKVSYLKIEYLQFLESYDGFMEEDYFSEKLFYLQLIIAF